MSRSAVKCVTVHQLSIPMRINVAHAASQRKVADPIVVAVELNGGTVGYGETLPRPYVTGESNESVVRAIERTYCPYLLDAHPRNFPEALELIESLPWRDDHNRHAPAARAAVELALLDVYARHFHRPISESTGWMGLNAFGPPGSLTTVRHGGVLTSTNTSTCLRRLRRLWWYGVRDFKLKVGDKNESQLIRAVSQYLARPLASKRATLRLDANGGWSLDEAADRLDSWRSVPIAAVEQPLPKKDDRDLAELKSCAHQPLMVDESLVTMKDAERLVGMGVADAFNIRISKCGGLLPSLRLANYAFKQGLFVQLGCMVGETSILSAAGRKFLELVPGVRFVEGGFGSFLLSDDIVHRPLRFGYGGYVKPLPGDGFGIDVQTDRLRTLSTDTQKFVM